ncbi:MAG: hypothetical protein A3C06_00120 [Candidatus Taylorbacteria bacterium RIFCSPHIGHO2_02_FULL_46_13]|uniref:Prepilin-type N-terminal cleavage/methylation domain-containing protein n=1 Tax=Candidatus Taylorbacteria bacterium RIFCSPHIGHO2_02_FULL_46_13 TaxID=1802312 RepID=A0A1G2MS30_9BACT|nr:MAG: hypothetical protein A3C06_00120 [Candidatus Taylorbacteria bacterium RIFCSPHIGHO2_02_FULL_46_13]
MRNIFSKRGRNNGFSIIELVIVVGILGLIVVTFSSFQTDVLSFSRIFDKGLSASYGATRVIKDMTATIRIATPSSLGAYPLASVSSTSLTFYADTDDDGLAERVRYFVASSTLRKGVIKPSGSPLSYNPANEKISYLIDNVLIATSTLLFSYYDKNYTGASDPLPTPVPVADVRLIKVTVVIDDNPTLPPAPVTVTTQIMLRNLKDNL